MNTLSQEKLVAQWAYIYATRSGNGTISPIGDENEEVEVEPVGYRRNY